GGIRIALARTPLRERRRDEVRCRQDGGAADHELASCRHNVSPPPAMLVVCCQVFAREPAAGKPKREPLLWLPNRRQAQMARRRPNAHTPATTTLPMAVGRHDTSKGPSGRSRTG